MIKSIISYVNFYFPSYKTQFYPDNFIRSCLVYQFLYVKYFKQKLDINQIIYKLSDYKHSCRSNSPILANHLIFNLAFREFWKQYSLGRGCVYVINSPFKKSEVLGYLTGMFTGAFTEVLICNLPPCGANFSTNFHNSPKFFQKFLDEIVCTFHFPFLQEIS